MRLHSVLLVWALAGATLAPALAQEKPVELKLAHWLPAGHPTQASMEEWGRSVSEASGGTITFKVYPAQTLGKAFDHYDMARDGIADVTYINPGLQPGRFPIAAAAELPLMIKNATSGSQAFDAWYRTYAPVEMKDVKFCVGYLLDPGTLHSKTRKIVEPADLSGMKVRPANATVAAMVTLFGGTNVQGGAPEARDLMEKSVVDATTFPWGSTILFGLDKVTKYHIDVPLYVAALAWVMNKDKYDAMSARQKKVIDDHCTNDWARRIADPQAAFENAGHARLGALPGHEVYALTPEQLATWRKAVQPLEAKWAEAVHKTGADPQTIMAGLRASLARYDAAF